MMGRLAANTTAAVLLCSLVVGFGGVICADDEPLYFPTIVSHARVCVLSMTKCFGVSLLHAWHVCVDVVRAVSWRAVFSGRAADDTAVHLFEHACVCAAVSALFARGVVVSPALSTAFQPITIRSAV